MRRPAALALLASVFAASLTACETPMEDSDPLDGENDVIPDGKADGGIDANSVEAIAVLDLVNDRMLTFEALDDDARLNRIAADRIMEHRAGADGEHNTDDDNFFDDLKELDDVFFVGKSAFSRLLAYADDQGYLAEAQARRADVVFSPRPIDSAHTARVVEMIDDAVATIDIAMYSYSNADIGDALERAVDRGVEVRFIFETAAKDRKLEGADLINSKSGRLEAAGVDVRWVNKIMHHKYIIVDGPRFDTESADLGRIATGSANWSFGGATKYDENTLFLDGHREVNLALQAEFNLMWNHSRELAAFDFPFAPAEVEIDDGVMFEHDRYFTDVTMTSANFDISEGSTTFRKTSRSVMSDMLVEAIEAADSSIWVSSGHLRSRAVSEALIAKAQNTDVDIKVYLDGQEYISEFFDDSQDDDLEDCLAEANTDTQIRNCMDNGFMFGRRVGLQDGIDVRYKYYAYRWHFTYADQMHNKYFIIDGEELITGSYNLSNNAERNSFENMVHLKGPEYQGLVDTYEQSFLELWDTERGTETLDDLIEQVETADVFPIVFDAMALTWDEVNELKSTIKDNCPQINSEDFRKNPQSHMVCER